MRNLVKLMLASAALAVLGLAIELLPSAAAQTQRATVRVIVLLKNQEPSLPATPTLLPSRQRAIAALQAPLLSQMAASHAVNVRKYTLINALAATVSPSEEAQLRSNSAVSEVVQDQVIRLAPPASAGSAHSGNLGSAPAPSVCAPAGQVQLNPQALETIHADSDVAGALTARSLGFNGSGVKVGFIADGLDINNPDFIRANGQHVFVDYKDFSGEGTGVATGGEEAFGDAASIAAQGRQVYNVAGFGPHAVTGTCDIRIEGVAPGASLVGLSIFGAEDAGFNSSFLQAIDYAVTVDHVNVLNESLGNNFYPDDSASLDLIKQTNDEAVAAGTTVTVSSGDAGVTNTIGTPSTDPNVISAGATTTYRVDLQDGYGGAQFPGVTNYLNNDVSSFSSGGFEQGGRTIDVVAPGELNWSLCSTDTAMYFDCVSYGGNPTPVIPFGGTSESSPLTAGVAALVIQAYEKTHGGAAPSPQVVKQIVVSTTDDIGSPASQQGAGLIDAYKAVQAAESYKAPASVPTPVGSTLLESSNQLNAVDAPGTPETLTDTITNNGSTAQTLSLSTRALGAYQTVKSAVVTLSDSSSPHTTDWQGVADNYEPITFNVPSGENRLNASIAFQNASLSDLHARVRLTLVDPTGALAAYSVPQGDGNYGNVQVTDPAPGTWTAYVWSRESSQGGTTGHVEFGASVANYAPFGRVSPSSLTLQPGQSAPVSLQVSTPSHPGDVSGAIVLSSNGGPSFSSQSTIPVTLRSLIPNGPTSFTATLAGGNGRSVITGQTFYYQFDLPQATPELNVAVKLANNPNNPFSAFLISPTGEALAFASNDLLSGSSEIPELGAQLHVLSPAQGAWTLVIAFIPAVSGQALTEPFTVTANESSIAASSGGLPNSTSVQLPDGAPVTYQVKITNTGPAPEGFFVDARLPTKTVLHLAPLTSATTTVPLTFADPIPVYLLPSHSTAFAESAKTTGSTPIQFDSSSPAGDPDIGSTVGSRVTATFDDNPIASGVWSLVPTVAGAFGAAGAPNETVNTAMNATSSAFDPTITAPTGDLWLQSTNPAASFSPTVVGPGQTATIPVTLTPTGTPGTQVKGTLYVDDSNNILFEQFLAPNGDEVAAIPYAYTISR